QITDVTVASNPKILTLNRQPARVLVGTRVGYLNTTTTQTSTTQTVEFLDVGTQLSVRPFVSKNGLIRLELRPQVSSFTLRQVTDNTGSAVTIPDEDTTEMTTNVMVRDGQTVVLGGLFTETTTTSRRQVPLLGDIPIIGSAFKGHDDETRRSEIIFLITPSIVNDTTLAEAGILGNEYLEDARFGARKSLLLWSRERRVGQLLLDAQTLADEGQTEKALSKIDRALRLSPMSPDARHLRTEISGQLNHMPSRSMLDDILNTVGKTVSKSNSAEADVQSIISGVTEFQDFEPTTTPDANYETPPAVEEEFFAEVPVESLSDASTNSFNEWDPASEQGFEQAEYVEAPETVETAQWAPNEFESFESQSEAQFVAEPVVQSTPESFVTTPLYTQVPVESSFETTSTASTETTTTEMAEPTEQVASEQPKVEFTETVASGKLAGMLVIPLPGGGSLQLDWPMSINDWSSSSLFTSVPTDSSLIEEIAD
ncbi:MAG: type II and III secretion system protein, partial [Phycisphaerales bacterium]|nr:type II and III secretion system protein [Phycisphaerales bacterium]